jgi:hypothetical protein
MTDERKGVSLAKGPVAILGAAMLAYGILALILGATSFRVADVPNGPITDGETFLGLESNGWTALLWIAAGGLLLLGSPLHWGAKTMALIVGLVLGAASTISLVTQWADGAWGVFGIFAANNWTMLAWGAVAAFLLVSALLPRIGGRKEEPGARQPAVAPAPPRVERERVTRREEVAAPVPAARDERVVTERDRGAAGAGRRVVAPADGDGPADHGRL